MPTYEYRCPDGHTFDRFFRKISDGQAELACPVCGLTAIRQVSGGAGLLFKGAGFYLTDYGKNAHRGSAPSGERKSARDVQGGESKGAESQSGESKGAESKTGESKATESKTAESKRGDNASGAAGGNRGESAGAAGGRPGGDSGEKAGGKGSGASSSGSAKADSGPSQH
jgi:putative FmdB family regulatory protein